MKTQGSFLLAAALVLIAAAAASAQTVIQITPNRAARTQQSEREISDEDLLHSVFDPVTDALSLTPGQKFRIITIAGVAISATEPMFAQLDELDDQVSIAAFSGALNETKLKEFSARQAALMAEISGTLARAKANFYKVLTPEQRSMVLARYKSEESVGAISNAGP